MYSVHMPLPLYLRTVYPSLSSAPCPGWCRRYSSLPPPPLVPPSPSSIRNPAESMSWREVYVYMSAYGCVQVSNYVYRCVWYVEVCDSAYTSSPPDTSTTLFWKPSLFNRIERNLASPLFLSRFDSSLSTVARQALTLSSSPSAAPLSRRAKASSTAWDMPSSSMMCERLLIVTVLVEVVIVGCTAAAVVLTPLLLAAAG